LDTSFDGDGLQTVAFDLGGNRHDQANALAVQADGRIVVAGTAATADTPGGASSDFAVVRITPAGALGTSFAADRPPTVAFAAPASNADEANAVAVQANGRIVVAGRADVGPARTEMAVARLLGPTSTSTVGAFDPATATWYLRNSNTPGAPDTPAFAYG